ncbi:hypothetical protein BA190_27475 [Labrys sp. WJW]|nr:hypothetical protein BA190_27475 [Labrys sp. WJW]
MRALVDSWFEQYPAEHRSGLIERFRASRDQHHKSAFFELLLHQLALATGHRVIAVEPLLPHSRCRPDFLLEAPDGGRFYLEAVLATGQSGPEMAAQARLDTALARIDRVESPDHFLDVTTRGLPTDPISGNELMKDLKRWIAGLPKGEGAFDVAPFCWEEHGARIELKAWPRHRPGAPGGAIGVRHFPFRAARGQSDIREAVAWKARKYGVLDHPLVVAVNSFERFLTESTVLDALFGSPELAIRDENGRHRAEEVRASDGVWWGKNGARKRVLSAVLSVAHVDPWNFARRVGCLVRNPWAALELAPVHFGLDEISLKDGAFQKTKGATLGHRLGLPDRWPEA